MLTLKRVMQIAVVPFLATMALNGCSTAEVAPDKSVMPEVPDYVKVPHPVGYEIAEIRALFESPLAPKDGLGAFADSCDKEFRLLLQATPSKEDRRQGAAELVSTNAEKMHWCFYGKVERMQNHLKSEQSWTERQKIVLDSYEFLTPISMAFLNVYHDSRYLRWATQYYSNISEWVFFRKVVPGPENTLALTTSATSDLEPWAFDKSKTNKKQSVFTRYGIDIKNTMENDDSTRAPATAADPVTMSPQVGSDPEVAPETSQETTHEAAAVPKESEPGAPVLDTMRTDPGSRKQVADQPLKPIDSESTQPRNPANEVQPDNHDTPFGL